MNHKYSQDFEELSPEAKEIIYDVIEKICEDIKKYKVDVVDLCEKLHIDHDEFIQSLISPKNDYSGYLDVLDQINVMLGGY